MKALAYYQAHPLDSFSIKKMDVGEPSLGPQDVLVRIKAIGVNPVDYRVRRSRSSESQHPVILGWDASGVIEKIGNYVENFRIGDEVYYAGSILRDGSYAEYQAVDSRLIAQKPSKASFEEAASLPLTSLTAWEALLDRGIHYNASTTVLIIGGAGGVGSMAIQILRAKTNAQVIATASRSETRDWAIKMGAHHVIDHRYSLADQLKEIGLNGVDVVFITTHTNEHIKGIPEILNPFGHLSIIEAPASLDIVPLKDKSLSIHWEMMFSKSMYGFKMKEQGEILQEIATLVDEESIKPTLYLALNGLDADNIKEAHTQLENGVSIGKIVIKV